MIENGTLGERIKECRQRQELTLKAIEARAGVSATHISEIERGKTSPTVGALAKIATALGKDITYFLEREVRADVSRQTAESRAEAWVEREGFRYASLTTGVPGGHLGAYSVELEADARWPLGGTDEANHMYFVRAGRVLCMVDGVEHVLEEGDSVHIGPGADYSLRNADDRPAQMLLLGSRRLRVD